MLAISPNEAHAAAILAGAKKKGAKPRPSLADQAQVAANWIKIKGQYQYTLAPEEIRKFHHVVLDDEAARLVTRTSHAMPKQIARMTELAIPPYDHLWVEMSYKAMDDVLRSTNGIVSSRTGLDYSLSRRYVDENERIAFLFDAGEGYVDVHIIQHADGNAKKLHEWPIGYRISNTGEPIRIESSSVAVFMTGNPKTAAERKKFALQEAADVWGYEQALLIPDLHKLANMAHVLGPATQDAVKLVELCMTELKGICRRAVAILALMNTTIIEIGEPARPQGRFMTVGGSKPYTTRSTAVLNIPRRVKHIARYVEDEIRHEVSRVRKRRHHVRGHFRHLTYEPINGEGWTPCFCLGREAGKWWHKHIHEHERGDDALGYVVHDYEIDTAIEPTS